jgi:hypothetical protein
MNRQVLLFAAFFSIAVATAPARADEPATATQPTAPSPDKSQYTLFNPVPADQLRDMDTDRPNVANTPHTVDAGHLQIETGLIDWTHFRFRGQAPAGFVANDFAFGQADFRLGVLNDLELNVVTDAYEIDRTRDDADGRTLQSSGYGDTSFGGKLNLWGNDGGAGVWATAFAIQPQLKFPTGRGVIGNGRFEGSAVFPLLVNLPMDFHLDVQPGIAFERNTADSGYVTGFANAVSLDRVVLGDLDVYVEYASDVTTERHVKPVQTIDVGCTCSLGKNVVLDTGVACGLNSATPNVEFVAGFSVRF